MPGLVQECLDAQAPASRRSRGRYCDERFFLYLGRHIGYGVCLEGALKLKEISYIPPRRYAAGEMKHGPIALLDDGSPVVMVANDGPVYAKVVSNIEEVRARGAEVIAVATEGNDAIEEIAAAVLRVPRCDPVVARHGGHRAAAASGLSHRLPARPERRPAAQPRQDRHRRVRPK